MRTLSALIQFPNSPGVFGHRAILMWGYRGMAGGFVLEPAEMFQASVVHSSIPDLKSWNIKENQDLYRRVTSFIVWYDGWGEGKQNVAMCSG